MSAKGGRPSVFDGKDKANGRVQGDLTARGVEKFSEAKERLARMVGWEADRISDADAIEYGARGQAETEDYLALKAKRQDTK